MSEISREAELSRACLLCTDTESGFRQSLMLIAVPGLHIATIIRGVPNGDLPKGIRQEDAEEACEDMVVNVEEGEFLIARLREWIDAHNAYNAARPGLRGRKSYTAEVKDEEVVTASTDSVAVFVDKWEPGTMGWYMAGGAEEGSEP